jgi:hypothetical protein
MKYFVLPKQRVYSATVKLNCLLVAVNKNELRQRKVNSWRRTGKVQVGLHSFLTVALHGTERSVSRPEHLSPCKEHPVRIE